MFDLVSGLFKSIFDLMSGIVGFVLGEFGTDDNFLSLSCLVYLVVVVVVARVTWKKTVDANGRYVLFV